MDPASKGLLILSAVVVLLAAWGILSRGGVTRYGLSNDAETWFNAFSSQTQHARDRDQHLLVYFTADWCGPCQYMKQNILPDQRVSQLLDQHYRLVFVDLTSPGRDVKRKAAELGVRSIPTMVVIDPWEGPSSVHVAAFAKPADMAQWLEEARAN
jgi:thiol:disulfide interchange protein